MLAQREPRDAKLFLRTMFRGAKLEREPGAKLKITDWTNGARIQFLPTVSQALAVLNKDPIATANKGKKLAPAG